jgi:tRNA threonylcarbamoyladenosine biosynthesis protein TsaE
MNAVAPDRVSLTTHSAEETQALGRALMRLLPDGALVALFGDLGAGKTCLVRGMAEAAGMAERVTSPTFTLVHEYRGARTVYHLDLYRMSTPDQVLDLGYEDLFDPQDGVCVVEWAERAKGMLPERRLDIHLTHEHGDVRRIEIDNRGLLLPGWERTLSSR